MILFFTFPSLTAFAEFYAAVGFSEDQGWTFGLQTPEIGGPVAATMASPLVFGFPSNLGELAVEQDGLFTGWRWIPSMN